MSETSAPANSAFGGTATTSHGAVPPAPAIPTGSVLTQVGSALGGILLLILFAGWLFRRLGFAPQRKNSALLKVTASCQVGQRERVVVVEIDNTWLVLGVTAQNITPLHTLTSPPTGLESTASREKPNDFRQLLQKAQLLQKKVKRPGKSV
ncbi:flagellar biosynthetic protein FliO [Edaphovirga cremea]|uniref:flagellar biosynthetic protein FliO n=1 Tax=Edaphovirga cremea TaxID=2267246 RepID=UPI000DEEEFD0|nr:flagellar biosynthetic protein FliO [Edaphovirga cremea]